MPTGYSRRKRATKEKSAFHPAALQKLVEAAYAKGVTDTLLSQGAVFVSGVGLIDGLSPEAKKDLSAGRLSAGRLSAGRGGFVPKTYGVS